MVTEIVNTVMADGSNRRVAAATPTEEKKAKSVPKTPRQAKPKTAKPAPEIVEGAVCPLCGKGHIIKGKTAFGCSGWREGCGFRMEGIELDDAAAAEKLGKMREEFSKNA